MQEKMYADGGPFDDFAGKDGRMNLEEAKAMNAAFNKELGGHIGEEIKPFTDEEWKTMYAAYNSLSDGEGFTKWDAQTAQGIMNKMRDW